MPPTALATCEIYGTIYDVFGQPAVGAVVGVMSVYKNGALILAQTKETTTDADGYFTMDLPRDSVAVLYANAPGLNLSCLGTPTAIPDADSAELSTIISDVDLWTEVPVAIPGGGASIGAPIVGGDPQSVLFLDEAGNLAQSDELLWDNAGERLIVGIPDVQYQAKVVITSYDNMGCLYVTNYAPTITEPFVLYKTTLDSMRNQPNNIIFSQMTVAIGALKPQDGYGQRLEFQCDTDVTSHRICMLDMVWTTAAESTRTSAFVVHLCNNGSVATEYLRVTPQGVILPADPTLPMHAATRQYVDSKGINLAAAYPWTGNHSWTQSTVLRNGAGARATFASGNPSTLLEINQVNHFTSIGPQTDYGGTQGGSVVVYRCGTGDWSSSSYGACIVNYGENYTWDFNAHLNVRGNLVMAGGFQSGSDLTLFRDPTAPMHAVTKQYVDNKPSGGSPAGTGAEIQYRASATTFGAVPGSDIGVSTNWPGVPRVQFTGVVKVLADPSTFYGVLELSDRGGGVYMAVSQINNTVAPFSAFQAIHSAANPGILYFGRGTGGFGAPDCARIINFYTGATGQEDTRRIYISKNGSVHVNEQSIVDSTYALTTNSGLGGGFANALLVNGPSDFAVLPRLWDGAAYQQVKIGAAGSGPGGTGRALYIS